MDVSALFDRASFAWRDLLGIDIWIDSTPTYSFTTATSVTIAMRWKKVGRLVLFTVSMSGTSIATTAGASYIDLPHAATGYGGLAGMTNETTNVAVGLCDIKVSNSRCYLPTQAASANTFKVGGFYEV